MIYKISDNIISPLGFSSSANYQAVKNEKTELKPYERKFDLPECFVASIIDDEELNNLFFQSIKNTTTKYTKAEKLAILSIHNALQNTTIDPAAREVLFILSTTKGNIELLEQNDYETDRIHLWRTAQLISTYFGNKNEPVVVSNACISGSAAQITAVRYLQAKRYKYVIVVGVDVLSKFFVSGFQSFKALSPERCKPFDSNRMGLNVGEAAATIIYSIADSEEELKKNTIVYENGAIRNDANHISGPSQTGEGLYNAITDAMRGIGNSSLSFINAHGTATPYNDDMESMAISRCNLNQIPVNSLKSYFGHTFGAAGILETIISSFALCENVILPNELDQLGVVSPINVNTTLVKSEKNCFLKLVSGFGGSNAAIVFRKINE